MDQPTLCCTLTLEELSTTGNVVKKVTQKNINLTLGRDEFREIQLMITFPKKVSKYLVKEILIHKKFVKDGKATIKLPDKRVHLMLSNCPPDRLSFFLKTLQVKLDCLKQKGFVSERSKLFSGKNHEFDEISPLTLKDLQTAHNAKVAETAKTKSHQPLKPSSLTLTRQPSSSSAQQSKESLARKRFIKSASQDENVSTTGTEAKKVRLSSSQPQMHSVLKMPKMNGISPSKILAKPIQLTSEQNRVLEAVKKGRNLFFTGSAGTGKSFLLKRIIGALPPNHTFATASTGVAACHIGGMTLHSFAGIGSGKAPLNQCVELASRTKVSQQWRACRHLIIDEISMLDGELFDKLETIARVIRKSDLPFGGIQLILCGDFLQLPPVTRPGETRKFCFESEAWQKTIDVTMQLTEVKRQSDKVFIDVLQKIRKGLCPDPVEQLLVKTCDQVVDKGGVIATKLCTHKVDVEQINVSRLKELTTDSKTFACTDSDHAYSAQLNILCPVPAFLELKIGAQVMLCKNMDTQRGLVNGARGVVADFEIGHPVIKFACGVTEIIKPVRWVFKIGGGNTMARRQLPLKLAWAISIHKSQGMTLDCVEMSLGKVFETGQAYVALSRAKSLEGLRVIDFDKKCVRVDEKVLRFYSRLELKHKMMHNGVEDDNEIFIPNPSIHSVRR